MAATRVLGWRAAITLVSMGLLLAACGDDDEVVSEVYAQSDETGYSMASRYGDLVWTAGHLPEDPSPEDGIAAQTTEVWTVSSRRSQTTSPTGCRLA